MKQNIDVLQEIALAWQSAKAVAVFTGAGMSTESGLPDFRSRQGLWKQRPESLATLAMLACAAIFFLTAPRWWMAALGTTIMTLVALWLWRRPEPRC